MELEYIYIEKFRNFKDQNFNFSGSQYKYNLPSNTLSLISNLGINDHFFGNKISNITGVIGKNSTGKSNLLDLICLLLKGGKSSVTGRFILLFRTDGGQKAFHNLSANPKASSSIKFEQYYQRVENLNVIFFSNIFDGRVTDFNREVVELTANKRGRALAWRRDLDMKAHLSFLNSDIYEKFKIDRPAKINVQIYVFQQRNFDQKRPPSLKDEILYNLVNIYKEKIPSSESLQALQYSFRLAYLVDLVEVLQKKNTQSTTIDLAKRNADLLKLLYPLDKTGINNQKIESIHSTIGNVIERLHLENPDLFKSREKQFDRFNKLEYKLSRLRLELKTEGVGKRESVQFSVTFDERAEQFFKDYIDNFPQLMLLDWEGISSGHKAYLNLFSLFFSNRHRFKQSNTIICIDEGDLYLHPQWQKGFVQTLVSYLPQIIEGKIQIVLSSHSPFIASDIPRSNIIFLDRTKNGETMTVDRKDLSIETFASNIHDLYVNSFFLDNGTMGEFAYNKLKALINKIQKLKNNHLSIEDKKLIEIIGDDLIKRQIKNLINDKPE